MKPSPTDAVRAMYETNADGYSQMMDQEITLPVYADTLGRLRDRIAHLPGTVVDTACGPGHMLSLLHNQFDPNRPLLGIDLAPRMVAIAGKRLDPGGQAMVGDMSDLPALDAGSAAAVINFFALHHLDPAGAKKALREWHRILCPGGQLLVAVWEGCGAIDYGDASDIVALRYTSFELNTWAMEAGFTVLKCSVEPVEDFPMDAVYLECTK